ncbi:Crp/Fnr family transcriptional regulator [Mucilaginibacter sp. ZT4R22]|uniref:Crp/Fnr family transcriptional regulator n=1 Tax=Mucilaginibacter pankratovii TaxID=2772110 RepID=A0ABR7WJQ1_9SPHI|nr:Crp/Fnr family transcriptional regulator [Mucilaginibacter pankratovii]MBD1362313.1 Crp/Fnr family transcriptional regulator [Mucilaginibacter pankratovii]
MDYAPILNNIAKYVTLTEEEEIYFTSFLHYKKVKRKQYLLEAGDINTKISFVTNGCLRSYAIDKNGGEHVLQFAPVGWWIVDMRSLLNHEPARLNIDAIEETELLYILKPDLDALQLKYPKFERFGRMLAENAMATYQHRQIDNMILSAMERYSNFCTLYPSLILSLPQKQVASYIGVTPEFLSKMLNTVVVK